MIKELISLEIYRGKEPLSAELEANAADLLLKVNSLLQELGITSVVMSSGYRSPEHNAAVGGKVKSNHMTCKAIDLDDSELLLSGKLLMCLDALRKRGMAMEDPGYCRKEGGRRWVHLQSVLPKSGRTVFIP